MTWLILCVLNNLINFVSLIYFSNIEQSNCRTVLLSDSRSVFEPIIWLETLYSYSFECTKNKKLTISHQNTVTKSLMFKDLFKACDQKQNDHWKRQRLFGVSSCLFNPISHRGDTKIVWSWAENIWLLIHYKVSENQKNMHFRGLKGRFVFYHAPCRKSGG